jgi:N-acetylneuraminic acid mutarotase
MIAIDRDIVNLAVRKPSPFSRVLIGVMSLMIFLPALGQQDNWQQMQSLGIPATVRTRAVGFSIGSKGYVGLGSANGDRKDFWEFDPATNTWTQRASYPGQGFRGAVGFSIGTNGYVGTGSNDNGSTADFWEFDPVANVWTKKADFPGGNRVDAVGFSLRSLGYVGTGSNADAQLGPPGTLKNDFWEYNPATNTWTQKASFAGGPRIRATGIVIGNKGYLGLGNSDNNLPSYGKDDFWQYDPTSDQWIQKANYKGGQRYGACGFSIGRYGYVGTGTGIDTTQSYQIQHMYDFYLYDTALDKWSGFFGYGGPGRENAVGFSIGNKGYFGMGEISLYYQTFGPFSDFYEFDPNANDWAQKASLGGGPRTRAVSFSVGGKGYVGTGFDGRVKKDFWVFDPGTNAWTQIADFGGGERESAFAFSVGNKGYVGSGDRSGEPDYKSDFYEYDPALNTWTAKAGVLARDGIIGFSIGNKGYAAMGTFRATLPNDFYEYDPVTNIWTQKASLAGISGNYGVGFSLGNTGYLGLQTTSGNFYAYDQASDTWTRKADFGSGQEGMVTGFSLDGQLYALSGSGANDFWAYNPATNSWSKKSTFSGVPRQNAIAFGTGTNGFIGFGYSSSRYYLNDLWKYSPGSGNNILTGVLTDTLCSRMSIPVIFTTSGTFNPGNDFTAQLSDTGGNFSSPINIGSKTATNSDTIIAVIPDSTQFGSHYRIRVVSSNPSVAGVDNGTNLTINPFPLASAKEHATLYLDTRGNATLIPSALDSGSSAYCGKVSLSLDRTAFDCSDLGSQTVTLFATDTNGNASAANSTVLVLDTIAPVVHGVNVSPEGNAGSPNYPFGYPPNQQKILFRLDYEADDNCNQQQVLITVTSSRPNSSRLNGSKDLSSQSVIDNHHVLLEIHPMSQRSWIGDSTDWNLVYFISITAKDASGNETTKTIKFSVQDFYLGREYITEVEKASGSYLKSGEIMTDRVAKSFVLRVMPNPSQHQFSLVLQSSDDAPLQLVVQNLIGQVIERRDHVPANGSLLIGSGYKQGFYVLHLTRGGEQVTIKLLKE